MMRLLYNSASSATFELENTDIYYANKPYDVRLDGRIVLKNVEKNVFSLFGLQQGRDYLVQVDTHSLRFHTDPETDRIDVRVHGAKGDGITDDTASLQTAVDHCPPGGTVVLAEGIYRSSPLFLKSDITIEITKTATLLGETDRNNYPILPAELVLADGTRREVSSWEGTPQPTFASLITGINVHNCRLIGEGTIDCNAQNADWWINHKEMRGGAFRPKGVFLSHCDNITLQGLTVKNTPSWNLHPYFSAKITFLDLKLQSPKDSPNTDGCNPESCADVQIIGVDFSVGDDCIAIKSGKFAMGMKYRKPAERITVRNCRMAYGHGAVVLGSEMSGGIRDLKVSQCLFEHTDRGLRIKTRRGRGESAIINGIKFENIKMDHVLTPLVINMFYFCDDDGKTEYVFSKEKLPVDERTPYLGSFHFKDIDCTNVHVAAGFFYGLPERPIAALKLENVTFSYADAATGGIPAMMSFLEPMRKAGLIFRNVDRVELKNVSLSGQEGPEVITEAVTDFKRE